MEYFKADNKQPISIMLVMSSDKRQVGRAEGAIKAGQIILRQRLFEGFGNHAYLLSIMGRDMSLITISLVK